MSRSLLDCSVGIMQGRLLPKYKGRFQAHPVGSWDQEFFLAREIGLDCIEIILDYDEVELNPLSSSQGRTALARTIDQSGVAVHSVCADFFMDVPLHSASDAVTRTGLDVLGHLIRVSREVGYSVVVLPCVDRSRIKSSGERTRLIKNLKKIAPLAADYGVRIALETDLPPIEFVELLDQIGHSAIAVNYDAGNSAALGFNFSEELSAYGKFVTDVHIKDRKLHGNSVPLGSGVADIPGVIRGLSFIEYKGPLILQTYRDEDGYESTASQLESFREILEQRA